MIDDSEMRVAVHSIDRFGLEETGDDRFLAWIQRLKAQQLLDKLVYVDTVGTRGKSARTRILIVAVILRSGYPVADKGLTTRLLPDKIHYKDIGK